MEQFKKELKELMYKHDMGLKEINNYDESREFCGTTTTHLTFNGEVYYIESLNEIIEGCFKKTIMSKEQTGEEEWVTGC